MRNLTQEELELVAGGYFLGSDPQSGSDGGSSVGSYVGNMAGAVCGVFLKKARGAAVCAAAGTFIGDLVDASQHYDPSISDVRDPMDTKLGR